MEVLPRDPERRVSIAPTSIQPGIQPLGRALQNVEALNEIWNLLPPPVRFGSTVFISAVVISAAAPLIRRAAKTLGIEPKDLLALIHSAQGAGRVDVSW